MRAIRLCTATVVGLALLPAPALAAEPYEGTWARTLEGCSAPDDAPGLTIIDLNVDIDGRARQMVDQPWNHCFIHQKSSAGTDTVLEVTCYKFWNDMRKRSFAGRMTTIRLSLESSSLLKIDDKLHRRCPNRVVKKGF